MRCKWAFEVLFENCRTGETAIHTEMSVVNCVLLTSIRLVLGTKATRACQLIYSIIDWVFSLNL